MVEDNHFPKRPLLLIALLAVVSALTPLAIASIVASDANAAPLPACKISSLKITASNGDGLHHGVEVIRFENVTWSTCALRGYPEIEAVLLHGRALNNLVGMYHPSPLGSTMRATAVEMSRAGGVNWSTGVYPSATAQKAFVPPLIILPARTGVTSSTLNWTDGPNTGTCPAFEEINIGLGASSVVRPLGLDYVEPLCYEFNVTPIVRGATGAMNMKSATTWKS